MEHEGDGRSEAARDGLTGRASDRYAAAFAEKVRGMDDESVLGTLIHAKMAPGEFTAEATAALEHELVRRGIGSPHAEQMLEGFRRQRLDTVAEAAGVMATDGHSRATIEGYLRHAGMDATDAMFTAAAAWRMPDDRRKRAAVQNMASGAALCGLGLAVAATNWYFSVREGDQPFLAAYAWWFWIVLAGAAQFGRGLRLAMRKA